VVAHLAPSDENDRLQIHLLPSASLHGQVRLQQSPPTRYCRPAKGRSNCFDSEAAQAGGSVGRATQAAGCWVPRAVGRAAETLLPQGSLTPVIAPLRVLSRGFCAPMWRSAPCKRPPTRLLLQQARPLHQSTHAHRIDSRTATSQRRPLQLCSGRWNAACPRPFSSWTGRANT
jgi:hypothetical protein